MGDCFQGFLARGFEWLQSNRHEMRSASERVTYSINNELHESGERRVEERRVYEGDREGLDGQADVLKNRVITVAGLEVYVAEHVKKLSGGQQTPTVAKPQTVPDYPIAIKK